jgi:CLIP-associating protein 1/2
MSSTGDKIVPIIKKGRTPSTTTLPVSSDESARGTPSPPLSQGSAAPGYERRSSPRQSKSSRGSRIQVSARPPMTPSKIRDATSKTVRATNVHGRPSSPLSVSSGNDIGLDESFSLMSFSSPSGKLGMRSRPLSSSLSLSEPEPAIEEELRATSAQAEAAAEQLLDLTQSAHQSSRPQIQDMHLNGTSVRVSNNNAGTPPRRASDKFIWEQARAFENSPLPKRPSDRLLCNNTLES